MFVALRRLSKAGGPWTKLESATIQVGSGIDGRHISQRVGIQEDRPSFRCVIADEGCSVAATQPLCLDPNIDLVKKQAMNWKKKT